MANPFGTDAMAAGYANSRPAVHRLVIERAMERSYSRALDVGCGAGMSTKALAGFVGQAIGLDPALAMLRAAGGGAYVAGLAEALPFAEGSLDLITAAGSLNYATLDRFFPEADRVLMPGGMVLVYDFSPGRIPGDEEWFAEFHERYPPPASEGRELNPEILAKASPLFRLDRGEWFEIGMVLTAEFYLNYLLTETNVASAVRRGLRFDDVRERCERTLWKGEAREVTFGGYFARLVAA